MQLLTDRADCDPSCGSVSFAAGLHPTRFVKQSAVSRHKVNVMLAHATGICRTVGGAVVSEC